MSSLIRREVTIPQQDRDYNETWYEAFDRLNPGCPVSVRDTVLNDLNNRNYVVRSYMMKPAVEELDPNVMEAAAAQQEAELKQAAKQIAAKAEERIAAEWANKKRATAAEAKAQELNTKRKIAELEQTVAAAVQTVAVAPEMQREEVLSEQMSIIQKQKDILENMFTKAENEQVQMAATTLAHESVFKALGDLLSDDDMGSGTKKNRKRTKKHKKKRGKKTRRHRSKRYKR